MGKEPWRSSTATAPTSRPLVKCTQNVGLGHVLNREVLRLRRMFADRVSTREVLRVRRMFADRVSTREVAEIAVSRAAEQQLLRLHDRLLSTAGVLDP